MVDSVSKSQIYLSTLKTKLFLSQYVHWFSCVRSKNRFPIDYSYEWGYFDDQDGTLQTGL